MRSGTTSSAAIDTIQYCRPRQVAEKFAGKDLEKAVIYKITLHKGTNAIDAMGISIKPEEQEVLPPPTGFFKTSRVYYEKDESGKQTRQIVELTYGI